MFLDSLVHGCFFFILEDRCLLSQISWLYKAGSLCALVAAVLKEPKFVYWKTNKQK